MFDNVLWLITLTIVFIIIGFPLLFWYTLMFKCRQITKTFAGPKPLPLLGNVTDIGFHPCDVLTNLVKLSNQYNRLFPYFVGPSLRICIYDADLIAKILSSTVHISKSDGYDLLKSWLGDGLLVSNGDKWRTRRKLITPSFHFRILNQFVSVFNTSSDVFIENLAKEASSRMDGVAFDINPYVSRLTLDIICESAMGVKINAQRGQHVEYVTAIQEYLDIFIKRFYSIWSRYDILFKWTNLYKSYVRCLRILHNFSYGVIASRRQQKTRNLVSDSNNDNDSPVGSKRKTALLDLLLESEASYGLSNDDIREEIDTFIFEGHDTTTSSIDFGLLCLAQNPHIQDGIYTEIEQILAGSKPQGAYLTMDQLQQMKYLDLVLKEVHRLYPSVPCYERNITTDEYYIDGHLVPQNTTITIFAYQLHRDPKYFPDPDRFDPLRHLQSDQAKRDRHNYAYVPFSAGSRNCIGQKFAMLELKTVFAKVIANYRLQAVEGFVPKLGTNAVLHSYNGIYVKLVQR